MKTKKIQTLLKKHVGKWIAVKDGKVVACARRHRDIYTILAKKGIDGAYVVYSPTAKEKKYRFLFRVRKS